MRRSSATYQRSAPRSALASAWSTVARALPICPSPAMPCAKIPRYSVKRPNHPEFVRASSVVTIRAVPASNSRRSIRSAASRQRPTITYRAKLCLVAVSISMYRERSAVTRSPVLSATGETANASTKQIVNLSFAVSASVRLACATLLAWSTKPCSHNERASIARVSERWS